MGRRIRHGISYQASAICSQNATGAPTSERCRAYAICGQYYAIRLLRQNTPWINRIYVVTDGQCPKWLSSSTSRRLNVTVVDHTEIFRGYEDVLPTFNSVTIEHMIAHIPGLSDEVLYLNDDFFVLRPITRGHFFGKKKILPRGQWRPRSKRLERIGERYLKNWKTGLVGYRGGSENIPFKTRFFMRAHTPIPIHIPSMQRILVEKNLLGRNISYRFRSVDQLDAIDIFLNHMLSRGMAKPGPDDWSYLEFEDDQADDDRCVTTLTNTSLRSETKFLCAQSLDRASPTSRTRVTDCLEGFLRQRSSLSAPA